MFVCLVKNLQKLKNACFLAYLFSINLSAIDLYFSSSPCTRGQENDAHLLVY